MRIPCAVNIFIVSSSSSFRIILGMQTNLPPFTNSDCQQLFNIHGNPKGVHMTHARVKLRRQMCDLYG